MTPAAGVAAGRDVAQLLVARDQVRRPRRCRDPRDGVSFWGPPGRQRSGLSGGVAAPVPPSADAR